MDASLYFSTQVMKLRDVKKCVEEAGYTAIFQHKNEKQLFIEFSPDNTAQQRGYWRLQMRSLSKIDAEDKALLADKLETVKTAIVIEHPITYMEAFGEMMQHVLSCHGGYVSFEYHLLDINTMKTIQDIE